MTKQQLYGLLAFVVVIVIAAAVYAAQLLIQVEPLPTFVQKATAVSNSATSLGVTFGSTPRASDFFTCVQAYGAGATVTPSAPVNFTQVQPPVVNGNSSLVVWKRFATSNDTTGPYYFGTSIATSMAVQCYETAYVDPVFPIVAFSTQELATVASGNETFNAYGIVPSVSGAYPITIFEVANEATFTPSTGYVNDSFGTSKTSGATNPVSLTTYRRQLESTNVTTQITGSATGSLTANAQAIVGMLILNHISGTPVTQYVNVTPPPPPTPTPVPPTPSPSPSSNPFPTPTPTHAATPTPTVPPTSAPTANPVASASPTPAVNVPTHIPIYADVNGCYHNSNNCNQPAPLAGPTASSAQVQSDINILSKYVDWWQTDTRMTNYGHSAGMLMGPYMDIFQLHMNGCCLASNSFPDNIIAHDNSGNQIYSPWANESTGGSFLGDPNAGPGNLASYLNGLISQQVNAQYGPYHEDFVRLDDANYPGRTTGYESYCRGFFNNTESTASCNTAHPALTGSTAPYLAYPPYNSNWIAGYKYTVGNASLPVAVNDGTDSSYGWLVQPNVAMVECEVCILGTNETTWINEVNAGLTMQHLGASFHFFRATESSSQDVGFFWTTVDMMLEMTNGRKSGVVVTEQPASGINPPSNNGYGGNIATNPLMYVVPTQWIGPSMAFDWTTYNYTTPPMNVGIGQLKTSTGAYAREALQCYIKGSPVGPCAFVVNPTSSTVNWPTLSRTYTKTIRYSGVGAITEFGDTGTLNTNAGTPPTTLAPYSGVAVLP